MKKYWLKDSDDCPIFEVEIKMLEDYYCDFTIYEATSWECDNSDIYQKKFIANVHWKWDFCTHWNFYGEDYLTDGDNDSYYHICGDHSNWIRMFAFIRKLMYSILGDEQNWYSDKDKELDEVVLKDYEIMEK